VILLLTKGDYLMELWTEKEKEMIIFGYLVGVLAGSHAEEYKKMFGVDLKDPAEALMSGHSLMEHEAAEIYKTFKPNYDIFIKAIREMEESEGGTVEGVKGGTNEC
jgi:hypothetical protein